MYLSVHKLMKSTPIVVKCVKKFLSSPKFFKYLYCISYPVIIFIAYLALTNFPSLHSQNCHLFSNCPCCQITFVALLSTDGISGMPPPPHTKQHCSLAHQRVATLQFGILLSLQYFRPNCPSIRRVQNYLICRVPNQSSTLSPSSQSILVFVSYFFHFNLTHIQPYWCNVCKMRASHFCERKKCQEWDDCDDDDDDNPQAVPARLRS